MLVIYIWSYNTKTSSTRYLTSVQAVIICSHKSFNRTSVAFCVKQISITLYVARRNGKTQITFVYFIAMGKQILRHYYPSFSCPKFDPHSCIKWIYHFFVAKQSKHSLTNDQHIHNKYLVSDTNLSELLLVTTLHLCRLILM